MTDLHAAGAGRSDPGQKRPKNEDAFAADDELGLYVVSDGMGGHAAGEVASAMAVETVTEVVRRERATLEQARRGEGKEGALERLAAKAVQEACRRVYELATSSEGRAGMGCTLTLLLVAGERAAMAHVGDSRLYLVRAGAAHQLSTDHTVAEELVRGGALAPDRARGHRYAHALTRAVGTQRAVQVDTLGLELAPGDRFLLCSDGLTNYIEDPDWLAGQVEAHEPDAACEALVAHANQAGGADNITCVAVTVTADVPEQPVDLASDSQALVKLGVLGSVFLFDELPLAKLARVLNVCRLVAYDPGQVVLEEGASCSSLMVVLEGRLSLTRGDAEIGRMGAGVHVGETTLLEPRPARGGLEALEPTRLLVLDRAAFQALVQASPWLGVQLLERLGRRLSHDLDRSLARREGRDSDEMRPAELF